MPQTFYPPSNQSQLQTTALWHWDTTNPYNPKVLGFSQSYFDQYGVDQLTKTGLLPTDLENFTGVPLVFQGVTPTPIPSGQILQYIRYAEDEIERYAGVLLCQTWVAAPPEITNQYAMAAGLAGSGQMLGVNYDYAEAAYDFDYSRYKDEGWGYMLLRNRPVQSQFYTQTDYTAVKNMVYIYPLLSQFFAIPISWFVEDHRSGFLRVVPSENVQMLPLFTMQLALMGFAETLAGAIHLQYTAGFTQQDYDGEYSFIKRLVLTKAAILALAAIQGTINLGATETSTGVDGLSQRTQYQPGAYVGIIKEWRAQEKNLMTQLINHVAGPMVGTF